MCACMGLISVEIKSRMHGDVSLRVIQPDRRGTHISGYCKGGEVFTRAQLDDDQLRKNSKSNIPRPSLFSYIYIYIYNDHFLYRLFNTVYT